MRSMRRDGLEVDVADDFAAEPVDAHVDDDGAFFDHVMRHKMGLSHGGD